MDDEKAEGEKLKKIFFASFGCASNLADSEIMKGLLAKEFEFVENLDESDLIIINTCVVKNPTEKRMIHKIKEFTKTGKPLIVAGCMPKTRRELIEKINPKASMIGPDSIEKIVEVVKGTIEGKKLVFLKDLRKPKLCLPRIQKNPIIRIIQIAEGCAWQKCSYCIVKFARGRIFSYPLDLIKKEAEQAIKEGNKEIWLTSQDTSSYGFERGRLDLPLLLKEICNIEGKFFVRVGMMNPLFAKKILDDLIQAYKNEKIFKFLHLPLQSGSNRILELMERGYSAEEFLKIVEKFKRAFPNLTLSTDVIVGFPSETEEDFEKTLEVVKKAEPDIINISKFGARKGTKAAEMKQVEEEAKEERVKKLLEIFKQISLKNNEKWVGWKGEVLIDEVGKKGSFVGRNFSYKPIVLRTEEEIFGKFVEVEVKEAKEKFLVAILNKS